MNNKFPIILSHPLEGREGYMLFAQSWLDAKREAIRIHGRYSKGWKLELFDDGELTFERTHNS